MEIFKAGNKMKNNEETVEGRNKFSAFTSSFIQRGRHFLSFTTMNEPFKWKEKCCWIN